MQQLATSATAAFTASNCGVTVGSSDMASTGTITVTEPVAGVWKTVVLAPNATSLLVTTQGAKFLTPRTALGTAGSSLLTISTTLATIGHKALTLYGKSTANWILVSGAESSSPVFVTT